MANPYIFRRSAHISVLDANTELSLVEIDLSALNLIESEIGEVGIIQFEVLLVSVIGTGIVDASDSYLVRVRTAAGLVDSIDVELINQHQFAGTPAGTPLIVNNVGALLRFRIFAATAGPTVAIVDIRGVGIRMSA